MMTKKYIKAVVEGKAKDLLEQQTLVFEQVYNNRSGQLKSALSQTPKMQGKRLTIKYPLHIRFLDLSKTRYGKRKKHYAPIYNKYTHGYLFTGIYARLRQKISASVKQVVTQIFTE